MRTLAWSLWLVGWSAGAWAQGSTPEIAEPRTDEVAVDEGSEARADEGSQAGDDARRLFERGMAAAEEARWADALPLFERSYALSGEAAALYNVGTTLRALGRHADAAAAFDRLLAENPTLDDARRADIVALRDQARARTAALRLVDDEARVGTLQLRLDARRLELSLPATLRVDEGTHVVDAQAEGHRDFRWEGALRAGDEVEVRLVLPPLPPPTETRPLRRSPALWITVGVVVLGGVATALALTLRAEPLQPREGTQVVRL